MLRIALLSRELDLLVELTSQALERRVSCRHVRSMIRGTPTLRSLVPLLELHGTILPRAALCYFQIEMERVLRSFEICTVALKQYSEQNWTMSDSLLDAFGGSTVISSAHVLANEKKILSDLQEELSKRIDHLTMNKGNIFDDYTTEDDLCMATICNRLFKIEAPPIANQQREKNDEQVRINIQTHDVANVEGEAMVSDLVPCAIRNGGNEAHVDVTMKGRGGDPSVVEEISENVFRDHEDSARNLEGSSGRAIGIAETAHILASMEDADQDEQCDTGLLDEDTEPLPDSMVNTQMAVTTLTGFTCRTSGSNVTMLL